MIFFASLGFIGSVYFGWWIVPVWSVALGLFIPKGIKGALQVSLSVLLVWSLLAYYQDGINSGLISLRLSGMFNVPRFATYLLTGVIGSLMAFPAFLTGSYLRNSK